MANHTNLHPIDLSSAVPDPAGLWVPGTLRLAGGRPARPPMWLHRAGADDVDDLHGLYERLSPAARRSRFFSPTPRISRSIASYLCTVDTTRHLVWLARLGDRQGPVIAEVQAAIDPADPSSAEVALAVADDWTGRGIGAVLIALLHDLAGPHGIRTLTGETLADNRACIRLLHSFGMTAVVDSGVLRWTGPVRPSGFTWWTGGTAAAPPAPVPPLRRTA